MLPKKQTRSFWSLIEHVLQSEGMDLLRKNVQTLTDTMCTSCFPAIREATWSQTPSAIPAYPGVGTVVSLLQKHIRAQFFFFFFAISRTHAVWGFPSCTSETLHKKLQDIVICDIALHFRLTVKRMDRNSKQEGPTCNFRSFCTTVWCSWFAVVLRTMPYANSSATILLHQFKKTASE